MPSQFEELGVTNYHWGVCGFTSTFYAMWKLNPGLRPALINAPKPFTVLAEIKTYLMMLKAEAQMDMLNSITDFTRSFGGDFADFTIDGYIERINKAVTLTEDQILRNPLFGIAMPPKCVADYVKRIWGHECIVKAGDVGGDAIIGVKDSTEPGMTKLGGLCHWMYRYKNRIYSWGKPAYGSVTEASPGFSVIWTLQIKP